jgi:hypothetical protein
VSGARFSSIQPSGFAVSSRFRTGLPGAWSRSEHIGNVRARRSSNRWKIHRYDPDARKPVTLNHWVVDSIPTRCMNFKSFKVWSLCSDSCSGFEGRKFYCGHFVAAFPVYNRSGSVPALGRSVRFDGQCRYSVGRFVPSCTDEARECHRSQSPAGPCVLNWTHSPMIGARSVFAKSEASASQTQAERSVRKERSPTGGPTFGWPIAT